MDYTFKKFDINDYKETLENCPPFFEYACTNFERMIDTYQINLDLVKEISGNNYRELKRKNMRVLIFSTDTKRSKEEIGDPKEKIIIFAVVFNSENGLITDWDNEISDLKDFKKDFKEFIKFYKEELKDYD